MYKRQAGITAETLYDCHHAFYCPSNMALCVVGNVDPYAVIALAEEVLPRERGEEIARCYGEEEDDAAAQKETVTDLLRQHIDRFIARIEAEKSLTAEKPLDKSK